MSRTSASQHSLELMSQRILGAAPFDDLAINSAFWRRAHDHHHLHRQLHSALVHRPGIVWGLEILTGSQIPDVRDDLLYVAPGVALDGNGQTIAVNGVFEFSGDDIQQGLNVLVLRWKETEDTATGVAFGGGRRCFGTIEEHDVQCLHREPQGAEIELARFEADAKGATIAPAADPFLVGINELDLSYRTPAFPACAGVLRASWLKCVQNEAPQNRARVLRGFSRLLQNARQAGFHIEFEPPFEFGSGHNAPELLFFGGTATFEAVGSGDVSALRSHLSRGGTLWGEGTGEDFVRAFAGLSGALGAKLQVVAADHPLLCAQNCFSAPPMGANSEAQMKLRLDDELGIGVILGDYSSLWGASGSHSRAQIADATDFGLNMLAHAARRARRYQLISLLTEGN